MTRHFQTSKPHDSFCQTTETRSCYRVELDEDMLLELAVWFSKDVSIRRIHLRDLGPPVYSLGKAPYPRIVNISASGLALSFLAMPLQHPDAFRDCFPLVLVYFKLRDPSGLHAPPLSFLAGYEVKRVEHTEGRLRLGMGLALDAVPHPGELILDFVDARKYGNACLTKWCEDMNRRSIRAGGGRMPCGVRLDMLLNQLDTAMTQPPAHVA